MGVGRPSGPKDLDGQPGGGLDAALAAAGRTGIDVGRGYYEYRHGGKERVEDSGATVMAEADRTAKGIQPRSLSDGDVRKRCLAAMAGTT